jgi:hypothetical protein
MAGWLAVFQDNVYHEDNEKRRNEEHKEDSSIGDTNERRQLVAKSKQRNQRYNNPDFHDTAFLKSDTKILPAKCAI